MRDLRIEVLDDGGGLYIAVDPDGIWARSTELDETITADWDAQGRILGLEVAGSTAKEALGGLLSGLTRADIDHPEALRDVFNAIGIRITHAATTARKRHAQPPSPATKGTTGARAKARTSAANAARSDEAAGSASKKGKSGARAKVRDR